MQSRQLRVPHSWALTPTVHTDDRGSFHEWFRADALAEITGRAFDVKQANVSVSARDVVRGIHFADVPQGQAKLVTAMSGSIVDFIVDIRVGSPTFGQWDSVLLDSAERSSVFISEGLGHAFVALQHDTVVSYLVSDSYRPGREHGINPLDPAIGLPIPEPDRAKLSAKDADAPMLDAAATSGLLPSWDACLALYGSLATGQAAT